MRSRSSRSTDRARRPAGPARGVDVYLFPAVVGGGLGDIEEVLGAGRQLGAAGFPIYLYRQPGRPLPRSVDGPWAWPALRRRSTPACTHRTALTVSPAFGVSAAPGSHGSLGRPGPWAEEATALEEAYGADRTLHASLEEFARTLTVREEDRERFREGGAAALRRARDRSRSARQRERAEFAQAFRRFRAFDRPNVLSLFAGLSPSPAFRAAFPEAVQTGPLWPGRYRRRSAGRSEGPVRWVWYASPSSAETVAPEVFAGLRDAGVPVELTIRSPRPWRSPVPAGLARLVTAPIAPERWERVFAGAALRIVTGSRTLLEALELGGPFLYFNGVLGTGSARRAHRPEKYRALLAAARRAGWPAELRKDLGDFARGRRVRSVVARAAAGSGPWSRFPRRLPLPGYRWERRDLGAVLVRTARELARPSSSSFDIVRRLRAAEAA